jgi:restriction system protein
MDGRAEKGIIITTAAFSRPAVDEANRSGAQPIDLVDGERLCELFEQYEIGLKNKRLIPVYDLDVEFFESI